VIFSLITRLLSLVGADDLAADVPAEQRGQQPDGLLLDVGRERLKRRMPVGRIEQGGLRESPSIV